MRITDVECILLKGDQTYGTRKTEPDATDQGDWLAFVRVETDEGLVGWSDVETLTTAAPSIVQGVSMTPMGSHTLRDVLVGEDPSDTEPLWNENVRRQSRLSRGVTTGGMSLNDDGTLSVPDGPGLGVDVDVEFVQHHRVN